MKIQSIPNPAIFVGVTRAPAIRVGVFHGLIFSYPDPNPPYPYPCHPKSPCSLIIIYPGNISHQYHNVPTKITENFHGSLFPPHIIIPILHLFIIPSVINSVRHGCDKPQGDTGRGMAGWGQGMKKSTREKPQPLWRVHG